MDKAQGMESCSPAGMSRYLETNTHPSAHWGQPLSSGGPGLTGRFIFPTCWRQLFWSILLQTPKDEQTQESCKALCRTEGLISKTGNRQGI